jgi:4-amino-4-deoxy-L-arabinose transferase-like glycosyltransferase
MLCSVALVACVGALARATTGDPRVTATAMAITALMPTAVFAGAGIWSEPTALFATVLAVVLLVRAEQGGGAARWAGVGAAAAVAFLTRTSVVFLLPFLLLCALRTRDARVVVALCIALAAPIAVWGMRNQVALGRFLVGYGMAGQGMWENNNPVSAGIAAPASGGPDAAEVAEAARRGELRGSWVPRAYLPGTAEALRDAPDTLEADRRLGALASAFVREHPGAYLRLLGFKLRRLLSAEPIAAPFIDEGPRARVAKRVLTFVERWAMLVLGVLGLVALHRAGDRWRHHHLVFALAGVPVVLLGLVNARFFLPIAVALAVPAAVALVGRGRADRRTPGSPEGAA